MASPRTAGSPENLAARLTVQRNGLIELLDDVRAELAQAHVELDRERAVSVGLLPRTYDIVGKNRADVQRDALVAAGIGVGGALARDIHVRFDELIAEQNAALVARSRERNPGEFGMGRFSVDLRSFRTVTATRVKLLDPEDFSLEETVSVGNKPPKPADLKIIPKSALAAITDAATGAP